MRGHPRDGSLVRSLSCGRGAGQAYVSTSREEISPKGPLAAELGACARQDRWESIHNLMSQKLASRGRTHSRAYIWERTLLTLALPNVAPSLVARSRSRFLGEATYRPSYRHPAVPTCSLGKPGPIIGSAATGFARSAVGGSFQTCLAEHPARATGFSL